MADRFSFRNLHRDAQDGGDYDAGAHHDQYMHAQAAPRAPQGETDPLAELARLIGQSDPLSNFGKAPQAGAQSFPAQPVEQDYAHQQDYPPHNAWDAQEGPSFLRHGAQPAMPPRDAYSAPAEPSFDPYGGEAYHHAPAAPAPMGYAPEAQEGAAIPAFLRHAHQQPHEAPPAPAAYAQEGYAQNSYAQNTYASDPYAGAPQSADPARYDDVLYGQSPYAQQQGGYNQPYDPNSYDPNAYAGEGYGVPPPEASSPRRGGMLTVFVVLALAFVGTAGAYAYRTFVGSPRSGTPPVIKADNAPNKIVPPKQAGEGNSKLIYDRVATNPSGEQIVPREEQPVDVKSATANSPRIVFPPLNQPNQSSPSATNAAPPPSPARNANAAATPGAEPRRVRTVPIRPDQGGDTGGSSPFPDPSNNASAPEPKTDSRAPSRTAAPAPSRTAAPAQTGNESGGPISLSPQAPNQPTSRSAALDTRPQPQATGGGNFVVQVSSQRSEADARASFRALQTKYPGVLSGQSVVVRKADLGTKGVYYRAMVGPFASMDEATRLCSDLKSAGGQCVVPRN